jgi:hypothetical protein
MLRTENKIDTASFNDYKNDTFSIVRPLRRQKVAASGSHPPKVTIRRQLVFISVFMQLLHGMVVT